MNNNFFETSESLAVARLVWMLLFSDNIINRKESDFFEQTLQSMNLSSEMFESSLSVPLEQSYFVVKSMSALKRRECARLLSLAVASDNVVELSELSRLNDILEKVSIFRPDKKSTNKFEGGFS